MKKAIILLAVLLALTGCAPAANRIPGPQEINLPADQPSPFGITPDLSYEVPVSRPGVLVNRAGYEAAGKKTVFFIGEGLTGEFEVIDAQTGETVYTGTIRGGKESNALVQPVSCGSFTELQQTGEYYIRTGIIGESYPFSIQKDIYRPMFQDVVMNCAEKWKEHKNSGEILRELIPALLAFEFYPELFSGGLEQKEEKNVVPYILTGIKAVVDEYISGRQEVGGKAEDIAVTVGVLAKFANSYKSFDPAYASKCLEMAGRLLTGVNAGSGVEDMTLYFAAAELYRGTGYRNYHTLIREFALEDGKLPADQEQMKLYADIAYLSTRRSVDIAVCDAIMEESMRSADICYQEASAKPYMKLGNTAEELFLGVLRLSMVDYIVTSHEYLSMIQGQFDYLLGCNEEGISYLQENENNSLFIYLLAVVLDGGSGIKE